MKRCEIWTAAGGPDYAGKPRPVLILQSDQVHTIGSITLCGLTTDPGDGGMFRPVIRPTPDNGLLKESRVIADKISTLPRTKLGHRIGALTRSEMGEVNRAVLVFLGLVG